MKVGAELWLSISGFVRSTKMQAINPPTTRREMVPDPLLFWFSGKGCGLFDRKNPDASRNCDQAMAV